MSVNSSSFNHLLLCANPNLRIHMFSTTTAMKIIIILPLSTFVLYLGHQRWRQHRSSKPATHSDIFTYHMAAMELIGVLGNFCLTGGIYTYYLPAIRVGRYISSFCLLGQGFFHLLTCVERYLAVVHPITYMGLRNARGAKIRNICIGCVWVLCFGFSVAVLLEFSPYSSIPLFCLLTFSIIIISFCSLSVLRVLIRPGPGEKERADQSKHTAFYTITAISVTVWLWFVGLIVAQAVEMSPLLRQSVGCFVRISASWFNLPCSLVSPLLYLHRTGKLSWCC